MIAHKNDVILYKYKYIYYCGLWLFRYLGFHSLDFNYLEVCDLWISHDGYYFIQVWHYYAHDDINEIYLKRHMNHYERTLNELQAQAVPQTLV